MAATGGDANLNRFEKKNRVVKVVGVGVSRFFGGLL